MTNKRTHTGIEAAAKQLGTQAALARALGVSPVTVHQWLVQDRPIPPAKCVAIEQITEGKVTRKHLRRDWQTLWPELAIHVHARD
jgi:DNA-binding transcriptional regulator YdaS (Cro superfamily)